MRAAPAFGDRPDHPVAGPVIFPMVSRPVRRSDLNRPFTIFFEFPCRIR